MHLLARGLAFGDRDLLDGVLKLGPAALSGAFSLTQAADGQTWTVGVSNGAVGLTAGSAYMGVSAASGSLVLGNGSKSGSEFLVNTTTSDSQHAPSVASLTGGGFVVTWTDYSQSADDTNGSAADGVSLVAVLINKPTLAADDFVVI